jgi:hypothetical protein
MLQRMNLLSTSGKKKRDIYSIGIGNGLVYRIQQSRCLPVLHKAKEEPSFEMLRFL